MVRYSFGPFVPTVEAFKMDYLNAFVWVRLRRTIVATDDTALWAMAHVG